jgi:putative ABC transport system permease protein
MKYVGLIGAGLRRRPLRSTLTVLAVAVSFLLFGVMHGVVSSFDRALELMSDVRLRVMSRANILESMPIAHRERLLRIEGVTTAVPIAIFVGYYQDPANGLNAAALDVAGFLDVLPEIRVPPEQLKAVLGNRMGAIAGVMLAEKYGWRIGDRIPIKSSLWMHQQTGQDWVFELEAIANAGPDDNKTFAQELYFHYDYLDQARATGQGRVNQFILGIDDSDQAQRLAQEVDALFANSSDETITMNEKQYLQSNLRRLGDVESFVYYILSAVLFSLLFMTATNMVQAIRERTSELGIMRAIGFQGRELALLIGAESAVLCLVGATLGLALAGGLFPSVFANFGFQGVSLGGGVYLQGLGIALGLAMVASAWPAWRAATLKVVDAIAGEGRR